ncbi:hypothetical protein PISMIDRAFT_684763 [Pisolithus microcarpus 441]|uniref:Uncharacterized protein n=1 Tax=Pisolithus microcarpus 441 TaxID=765257 RepID=A0A0C9ZDC5_9AGAM|nr:hypothetical protein PISMIDRAFT_684763 [Pisolithus microcarpus 441]
MRNHWLYSRSYLDPVRELGAIRRLFIDHSTIRHRVFDGVASIPHKPNCHRRHHNGLESNRVLPTRDYAYGMYHKLKTVT